MGTDSVEAGGCILSADSSPIESASNLCAKASLELEQGQKEAAGKSFQAALLIDCAFLDAHLGLIHLQAMAAEFASGIKLCDEALALFEGADRCRVLISRGHLKAELDDIAGAAADLMAATKADPSSALARGSLGHGLLLAGEVEQSLVQLDLAIDLDPGNADYLQNRAHARALLSDFDGSFADFALAIDLAAAGEALAKVHSSRGTLFKELGRLAEARQDFEAAVKEDSGLAFAWYALGDIDAHEGRVDLALAELAQAIALDESLSKAHETRGFLLWSQDRAKEAVVHYDQAITLDPDHADCYYSRGLLLKKLGQHEAAIDDYRNWRRCRGDAKERS